MNCFTEKAMQMPDSALSYMNLREIKNTIHCKTLTDETLLDREIKYCFAADLMSDVLRYARVGSLLLTGLTNNQVLQVALLMDLKGIVFVRGKVPTKDVIGEAAAMGLPLLTTDLQMFDSCGKLYAHGLKGGRALSVKTGEPSLH